LRYSVVCMDMICKMPLTACEKYTLYTQHTFRRKNLQMILQTKPQQQTTTTVTMIILSCDQTQDDRWRRPAVVGLCHVQSKTTQLGLRRCIQGFNSYIKISKYRFSLPECVNDGTTTVTHNSMIPKPCLWVDGFTNTAKNLQGLSLVSESIDTTHHLHLHSAQLLENSSTTL